jgi:charged multivesicular body protein 2A
MSFLFGKRETPEEMLRKNQRALNKAMRDLDRERTHLEQQEKKVIVDIKKMAKQGQMVRTLSRFLITVILQKFTVEINYTS